MRRLEKKTLNLEHIFEALKQLKFHKHIELLAKESKTGDNDKDEDEDEEKNFENKNLKKMINKKKKRGGRKKKYYENEEERKDMIEAENKIFEDARLEMMKEESQLLMNQASNEFNEGNEENVNENEDEKEKNENNAKLDKNLFIDNGGEEDINFD